MIHTPTPDNSLDKYDEPRLHMERLLQARLVEFDLSLRILIPLENAGIKTLGDLTKQTSQSLRAIKQIGQTSMEHIVEFLKWHGLSLADK